MKPTPNDGRHPRERGAIAAFTGIVLMTLVGMTVVGVDLGRLAFTATEVQAVAEVAATGYARSWLNTLASGGSTNDATHAGEAMQVIDGNNINGDAAESANIQGYERGRYEFTTNGPFVPGGSPENAVRATATETVTNFFGALFGTPETTVTKTAVATLTCGSRARTLPLAVGDCQFEGFDGPEDCDDLPSLTQQNVHVDDSCWTSLSTTDPANANDISDYISAICGLGGTTPPPPVSEGQDIRVAEGGMASVCQTVRDCFDAGVTEFIVPVVACEGASATTVCAAKGSGSLTINGFARIVLSARPACTGSPKTIPLQAFCNTDPTDGVGGNCDFGNFKVAMVE